MVRDPVTNRENTTLVRERSILIRATKARWVKVRVVSMALEVTRKMTRKRKIQTSRTD